MMMTMPETMMPTLSKQPLSLFQAEAHKAYCWSYGYGYRSYGYRSYGYGSVCCVADDQGNIPSSQDRLLTKYIFGFVAMLLIIFEDTVPTKNSLMWLSRVVLLLTMSAPFLTEHFYKSRFCRRHPFLPKIGSFSLFGG